VSHLLERAQALAPLFRDNARAAEVARRPGDHVISAVKESGLFALMVPKAYGGHEEDLDTFFDVVLTLSRADASMGWLTGFLIEHNLWVLNYADQVCNTVFGDDNYVLAPATLNVGAGTAEAVKGGYRLSGRWQWGTGILHSRWVLAGGLAMVDQTPTPTFFLLPIEDVELIDTWFMSGMCATGSWDFKVDDVFIPEERAVPFQSILDATSGIADRFDGPLYRTPLMPVLGFAAGLPILGAAQSALSNFAEQMRGKLASKTLRSGMPQPDVSKVLGEVSLKVESAELLMRSVLQDVMDKRNDASAQQRSHWLSQIAYAVHTCKEASIQLADVTGASGGHLDNPVQRAVRDIAIASNHVVFSKDSQYTAVGRSLLGQ
jgi:3-hydroxy-9,10-secoandrosta-1,3,5(10)-triene-9,17-dione monooxygenase